MSEPDAVRRRRLGERLAVPRATASTRSPSARPTAEVIVADCDRRGDARRRSRAAGRRSRLLSFDEPKTIPELRAAGIFAATAPYVAVIEDHCRVTPGWAGAAVAAHRDGSAVVGGPMRNVVDRRALATGLRSSASTAPSWSRCRDGRDGRRSPG